MLFGRFSKIKTLIGQKKKTGGAAIKLTFVESSLKQNLQKNAFVDLKNIALTAVILY